MKLYTNDNGITFEDLLQETANVCDENTRLLNSCLSLQYTTIKDSDPIVGVYQEGTYLFCCFAFTTNLDSAITLKSVIDSDTQHQSTFVYESESGCSIHEYTEMLYDENYIILL